MFSSRVRAPSQSDAAVFFFKLKFLCAKVNWHFNYILLLMLCFSQLLFLSFIKALEPLTAFMFVISCLSLSVMFVKCVKMFTANQIYQRLHVK